MKSVAALAIAVALGAAGPAFALSPNEAEAALRTTIIDLQTGNPDYTTMTPPIAEAIRTHADVAQQLAALGPPTMIVAGKKSDPFTFVVTFESGAVMNWTISFTAAGKINSLDATGK